jgi:hypothetical protein
VPPGTETCLLCERPAAARPPASQSGGKRAILRVDCAECGTYQVSPTVDLDELRALTPEAKAYLSQRTRALLHRVPLLLNQMEMAVARERTQKKAK